MSPTSHMKSCDPEKEEPDIPICNCIATSRNKNAYPEDFEATENVSRSEESSQNSAETAGICRNLSESIGTKVTELDLSGQGLKCFPDTRDLNNLKVLNLSCNEISELPSSLKSARFLRVLNVSKNQLTEFPKILTDSLHILKELNLSFNAIKNLPRPMCYQHLTVLNARECQLSEFPLWVLLELHVLEILDLSSNRLFLTMAPIPPQSFHQSCNNVRRLNISNTLFSDTQVYILSHFRHLEYLDVSNYSHKFVNSFSGFDDTLPSSLKVVKATNVRIVDTIKLSGTRAEKVNLSRNSLVMLNQAAISIYMRFLVLYDCYLSDLPDNFGEMVHLEYLNLSHNDLSSLPTSFACLTELVHLDLYHNSFCDFPSEELSPLKKVTCFDMCMNPVGVPSHPMGEDRPSYECLKSALRSAISYRRSSGKCPKPKDDDDDPRYSCYGSCSDDEDSDGFHYEDLEVDPNNAHTSMSSSQGVKTEEEDWDTIDSNGIYSDATDGLAIRGLNYTGDPFAGATEDAWYRSSVLKVPERIRSSPLFYYRVVSNVSLRPSFQPDTIVEGQFDDAE